MLNDQAPKSPQPRVGLAVTGGIAAYKAVEILRGLQKAGCVVSVAMTPNACKFIAPLTFRALSGSHVIVDDYAADNPDPIAHINFSQTIDLLIVAPATANVIAKFASGIADDFVTSTYLACTAPVLVAPAMNTMMLQHPATQRNLEQLYRDGVKIVSPDAGEMACGTIGPGRLSDPEVIVAAAIEMLHDKLRTSCDLSNENILITSGPTREAIDPVRYISNRSSGRMGFALAEAAAARGAAVTVVTGPVSIAEPAGVRVINITSTEEMHEAVRNNFDDATIFIGAAAVADYRPLQAESHKIKKSSEDLSLKLTPTPDILSWVGNNRHNGLTVVGFAAETSAVETNARKKLMSKKADIIVANDVSMEGAGFDRETNIVTIFSKSSADPITLPIMSKREVADRILDEAIRTRSK